MTPLDIIEARYREVVLAAPFYDVVNVNVDVEKLPAVWGGILWQAEQNRDLTMGSHPLVEETGTFTVGLFAHSGTGPRSLDAAIVQVRDGFHGWQFADLRIDHVEGPLEIDPQADGNLYRRAMALVYSRLYYRDATGPGFSDVAATLTVTGAGIAKAIGRGAGVST